MAVTNKQTFTFNNKVNVLCESYNIREQVNDEGIVDAVYLEGVAITFGKPTRNRVSYTARSGISKRDTLVNKPFLDTHNDSSIRTHPPFGHVESVNFGKHPKNGLPCLSYKVNIDPEEKVFIRKAKRKDIPGVSIQVLVDDVEEKEDSIGSYIEANIREYLELSAVLIPGDGDTSMTIAERFSEMLSKKEGVISPDGIPSQKKVLSREDDNEDIEDEIEDIDIDKMPRFIGNRETEAAYIGCQCPACGHQMLKDSYSNGFRLRCPECYYNIDRIGGKEKMAVKPVLREMGYQGGAPPQNNVPAQAPSNDAPVPPQQPMQPMQQPQIPDHTHPEYDQLLVKIQEIESELQNNKMGGIQQQEGLEEGKPEDDEGKPTGNQKDPTNVNAENMIKSIVKKVVEELNGVPERDIGKGLDKSGPENTSGIPQSTQPPEGEAPSGGGFDSDDKTNKDDGDKTASEVPKPAGEYDKLPIKKNKLEMAKSLIEHAKALMQEANDPDPSQPNPGAEEDKPKQMDDSVPNKSPIGGTEQAGEGIEDPETNAPNEKRPIMKEEEDGKVNGEEEEEEEDKVFDETFKKIKKEVMQEQKSGRQSVIGMTSRSSSELNAKHEEFKSIKERSTSAIKEYLTKAGHGRALGYVVPPSTY